MQYQTERDGGRIIERRVYKDCLVPYLIVILFSNDDLET